MFIFIDPKKPMIMSNAGLVYPFYFVFLMNLENKYKSIDTCMIFRFPTLD